MLLHGIRLWAVYHFSRRQISFCLGIHINYQSIFLTVVFYVVFLNEIRAQLHSFTEYYLSTFSPASSVDELWNIFNSKILDLMNNYIPTKLVQSNAKQSWINQNVKKIRRRKQRLYNKARSTNLVSDWKNYKEAKKQMQKVTRQAFNKYMYRLIHNSYVNGKRKRFYKHIKSLRSDHCGIPSLQKDDYIYTEGYAKANLLNDYFCSVFSQDGENPTPTLNYEPFSSIPPIELNISGICKILKDLDPSKAPGPDHIPIKFLKLFASELSPSLLLVYKASLEQGVVPSAWKKALFLRKVCVLIQQTIGQFRSPLSLVKYLST